MKPKTYSVYLMTNFARTTLYIGVTNNLVRRVYEHKSSLVEGFTKKYKCKYLMYFETTSDVLSAIAREKEIKGWRRDKKDKLINSVNPAWRDLSSDIGLETDPSSVSLRQARNDTSHRVIPKRSEGSVDSSPSGSE